jgi:hypothetical protein
VPKILFITGVPIDKTPVVKYAIEHFRKSDFECIVKEYNSNPIIFIISSLYLMFFKSHKKVFFVGLQTLPILFLSSFLNIEKFFWFLESYYGNENKSFVLKLTKLEKIINWHKVKAIFPIKERSTPYASYPFKDVLILPNAARSGNLFTKRIIKENDKIKLVFYGALNESKVFIAEFISFCINKKEIHLDIIGSSNQIKRLVKDIPNITYIESLPHAELIKKLSEYHYSIIGYKPINFNAEYCAPNKLYEALSLSLPSIINIGNPSLVNIDNIQRVGILYDFNKLDKDLLDLLKSDIEYHKFNKQSYQMYCNFYNLDNFIHQLYI